MLLVCSFDLFKLSFFANFQLELDVKVNSKRSFFFQFMLSATFTI